MGQKHTATKNWTVDDWAFGTGENAVPLEEVIEEAKTVPARYFGGRAIGNDPTMQQMQQDLLSFDDTIKRIFFRRKKNKRTKQQDYSDEQYYAENENQAYYDQNQQSIPEVDEEQFPSDRNDNNEEIKEKKFAIAM